MWKVKFKIVRDLGPHMSCDEAFHMAKVEFSHGETRIASFSEENFRRLKKECTEHWDSDFNVQVPGKWTKALASGSHMGDASTSPMQTIPMLWPHPKAMNLSTRPERHYSYNLGKYVEQSDEEKYRKDFTEAARAAVLHPTAEGYSSIRRMVNAVRGALGFDIS